MDKVKIALALLKKHHFWVMTGAVVLLSFTGWFLASSKLWAEYQTGRDKVNKKFADLTAINTAERENQKWIEGLDAETKQLKTKVRIAWDKVYREQKDHVLKWPVVLGRKNVEKLESLGPNEPIPPVIRRTYLNYIQNEFPNLLKIVDARDAHQGTGPAGKKGAVEGDESTHDYKVIWNGQNQGEIFAKLDLSTTPTDQQVRNIQEDLWVYQALLTIISQLNDRATGNYNAKVKEIQSLLIGAEAAAEFQSGMSEGHVEKRESTPAPGAAAAQAPAATVATGGRYVDAKGVPLPDGGGAAPPPSPDAPPAAAAGAAAAEFKRMPVVMRLIMDQREISRLLVECANSPLPVEVRQFRLHSKKGMKTGQGAGGAVAGGARGEDKDQSTYDMAVEVEGIIYIFNPPDQTKLGNVAAAAATGAQPGAEAPPPSATGNAEPAAAPAAADAGGAAPAEGESGPDAAEGAAGPAEAMPAEGEPDESPEPEPN